MTQIYLIRHGETAWSKSGQHTSFTDLSLTENGKAQAQSLAQRLKTISFNAIFVSPLKRALETCTIAGYADRSVVEPRLSECNYGAYEGITSKQIRKQIPDWNLFTHGCPNGESSQAIMQRAQTMSSLLQKIPGPIAVFSHGHFLRALAICYIQLPLATARHFLLSPASVSLLCQENECPAISFWNDISHLM
jgi:broad specificity phosphatase PhoE